MQQHRYRHRTDAAGNGTDPVRDLADRFEVDVANKRPIRSTVDADVDDGGAGPDHVGGEESGLTDRDDDDVGLARDGADVRRTTMAYRNRGIRAGSFLHEDEAERLADYIAAPDDDYVAAIDSDVVVQKHLLHAVWCTRQEAGSAGGEQPQAHRPESVDVLRMIDGIDDRRLMNLFWQRQLHQNPMHRWVNIQLVNDFEQSVLRRVRR